MLSYDVVVPPKISIIGVYTSNILFLVSIHAYYDNYTRLSYMLMFLYCTSVIHWSKIYRLSLIKILDMLSVIAVALHISIYDSLRWRPYRYVWFLSIFSSFIAYAINQYIFYNKINNPSSKMYCLKDTPERENAYYHCVIVHTTFFHIITPMTCSCLAFIAYLEC